MESKWASYTDIVPGEKKGKERKGNGMKRRYGMLCAGVLSIMMMSLPALAATWMTEDGKIYVIPSGQLGVSKESDEVSFTKDSGFMSEKSGQPDQIMRTGEAANGVACTEAAPHSGIGPVAEQNAEAAYSKYAQFGLSYDADKKVLYYYGQRVRVFEDMYPLDAFGTMCAGIEHFDPLGIIDVAAQRDLTAQLKNQDGSYDPGGVLKGLKALSDAEFAVRDLVQWKQGHSAQTVDASSGLSLSAAQKAEFYAPYAEFGLTYDEKTDTLSYQGQTVRDFLDVRQSNGESFSSGRFQGVMTKLNNQFGTIDVTTVRDYERPDAQGDGKLLGIEIRNADQY